MDILVFGIGYRSIDIIVGGRIFGSIASVCLLSSSSTPVLIVSGIGLTCLKTGEIKKLVIHNFSF